MLALLPPPHAGMRATPAMRPSRARLLIWTPSCFRRVSISVASIPSDIVNATDGAFPVNGEPTNPDVGAGCELECAVVEMVSVTAVVLLTVTVGEGEKLQLAPVGRPVVQANVTAPLKLLMEVALRL